MANDARLSEERTRRHMKEQAASYIDFICRFALSCLLALALQVCAPVMAQQGGSVVPAQQNQPDFRLVSSKGSVKVPFDLFENNILLQFRVNNSQPIWFIFDTGASVNVINEKLANNLGLTSRGVVNPSGGGGTVSGTFSEGATVGLPGVEAFKQRFFAIPLDALPTYFGRDVEGIIGTDFIRNFVVEIDYTNETLTFYDPKTYNLSGEPDTLLLENRDGTPYVKVALSLDGRNTITDQFELDSGSIRILQINRPFADRHKILTILPESKVVEGVGGAGIGGKTKFVEARIHSFKIGRYTLPGPVISVSQDTEGFGASNDAAGVIGTELLRRFKVTLDYQSQRMKLSPNARFDEPFEVDMSGLELTAKANDFKVIQVSSVRAGFPAAEAGLREGDTLVAIDDHPVAELGLDELTRMFRRNGKEYRLIIKRGSEIIRVRLRMKRVV